MSVALGILALGIVLLLLDGRYHLNWVSPGELSSPHTAIAGRTPEQCGACHAAPAETTHGWIRLAFSAPPRADSERCLACHFGRLDPAQVRADHSVAAGVLTETAAGPQDPRQWLAALWGPPRRSEAGLPCARCHQEHGGREADLTALDDVRCQSCHSGRFSGFTAGHPSLVAPVKLPSLGFDHVQHQAFWPDQRLTCEACHALGAGGLRMRTAGYRRSCAGCHSQGQDDYHDYALKRRAHTVLQPPDMEVSAETAWPVASGVVVSPLMWLLLAGDDRALAALEDLFDLDGLGLEAEPFEWYPDDEGLKDQFAQAFYRLLDELAAGDGDGLMRRLAAAGAGDSPAAALVEQLLAGQFALQAYRARWYGAESADSSWTAARAATGWMIDESEAAVRYRPTGHGDPLLRAWIELTHQVDEGPSTGFRGRLYRALGERVLAPGGWLYESCTTCHRRAGEPGAGMLWTQIEDRAPDSGYAKFTHRSHFDIRAGNESCSACHRLGEEGGPNRGFDPYQKEDCARCHRPELAPEDCLHCHNYHFTRP